MATRKVKNKKALKTRKHKGAGLLNKAKKLVNNARMKIAPIDTVYNQTYDIVMDFKKGKFDLNEINNVQKKINHLYYYGSNIKLKGNDNLELGILGEILNDIKSIIHYMKEKETIKENLKDPESNRSISANMLEGEINALFTRNSKKDKNFKLLTNNHKRVLENLKQAAKAAKAAKAATNSEMSS